MNEINELPSKEQVIKQYAEIQNITENEATEQVGNETVEEILMKIKEKTIGKINEAHRPMNRAQRRAAMKRAGRKGRNEIDTITETATKLNYIDLIQKLRELNKKREEEGDIDAAKNNGSTQEE